MENLKSVFDKGLPVTDFAEYYMNYLSYILSNLDYSIIGKIVEVLETAAEKEKTIYFIGNGGSAATASHFANDIAINTKVEGQKPYKVVSLTDNPGILSCIGNDYGFDELFRYQLMEVIKPEDVLVAMSVSGNSVNVVKAVEYANQQKAITVGLTGFDGGKLKEISNINFHIKSNPGEYGPVEDVFQILDHFLYTYLTLKSKGTLKH